MRGWTGLLILCLLAPAVRAAEPQERVLEIEMGKISGAMLYQVEIRSFDPTLIPTSMYNVSPDAPILRARLLPGRYSLSTRASDGLHLFGAWGPAHEFWVEARGTEGLSPEDGAKIHATGNFRSLLFFHWPRVPGASQYAFVVKGTDGHEDAVTVTPELWIKQSFGVNAVYQWTVVPMGPDDLFTSEAVQARYKNAKFNRFSMVIGQKGLHDVVINIAPVPGANKYLFEFRKLDEQGLHELPRQQESASPGVTLSLLPGAWEVRAQTWFPDGKVSAWSSYSRFDVAHSPVPLLAPAQDEAVDADEVELRWSPIPDAHHYVVYLYDEAGQFLKSFFSKSSELTIPLPHKHSYHWLVLAHNLEQTDLPPPPVTGAAGRFKTR